MKKSIIEQKSFEFAVDIVELHKVLNREQRDIARQILRSGTSIGANVSEAVSGQSKRDFIAKLHISRKEAYETRYWINLLESTNYLNEKTAQDMHGKCNELIRILSSIIITSKRNEGTYS